MIYSNWVELPKLVWHELHQRCIVLTMQCYISTVLISWHCMVKKRDNIIYFHPLPFAQVSEAGWISKCSLCLQSWNLKWFAEYSLSITLDSNAVLLHFYWDEFIMKNIFNGVWEMLPDVKKISDHLLVRDFELRENVI